MKLYSFPQSKHHRRQNPPQAARYQTYKAVLRVEFSRHCVYCREPDNRKGVDAFGVDHYRPRWLFPHLAVAYANLFYACNTCNRRKGRFWPRLAQRRQGQFIVNPCDHTMSTHLRFVNGAVEGRTPAGLLSTRVLDLNDPEAVRYRIFWMRTLGTALDVKKGIERDLKAVTRQRARAGTGGRAPLARVEAELRTALREIEEQIAFAMG